MEKSKEHIREGVEEMFLVLFESRSALMAVLDDDLKILRLNQLFLDFLEDHQSDEYIGRSLTEMSFWRHTNIKLLERYTTRAREGAEQVYFDIIKTGTYAQTFEIKIKPMPAGFAASFIISLRNITEGEEKTSALSIDQMQWHQQEQLLAEVAKLVSHDLRAPATNISYLMSLLNEEEGAKGDEQIRDAIETSINEILSGIELIGNRLNDRIQGQPSGQLPLRETIDRALLTLKDEIKANNARVVVDIYDNSDWDLQQGVLEMCLNQLISNSLKFKKKEVEPKIVITAYRHGGQRKIEVKDNGLGFDTTGREQNIFGLFQTFHSHPQARGVGLFQVKNRLAALGGDVHLESSAGEGTTVTLNFN